MDVSKMYCRVDSEHFDEFVKECESFFSALPARARIIAKSQRSLKHQGYKGFCHVTGSGDVFYVAEVSSDFDSITEFKGSWSIYNNDKPLGKLTDEQAAELFIWFRKGGEVECSSLDWSLVSPVSWLPEVAYRAKSKSERDLFIEAGVKLYTDDGGKEDVSPDGSIARLFGIMFDSGKFKVAGDSKTGEDRNLFIDEFIELGRSGGIHKSHEELAGYFFDNNVRIINVKGEVK